MSRRSFYISVPILIAVVVVIGIVLIPRLRKQNKAALQVSERLEIELITISEWGFEPKQITRSGGPFGLRIENRSGLQTIKVVLANESGAVVRELPVSANVLNWSDRMDLAPGQYTLLETHHSEWKCQITIAVK